MVRARELSHDIADLPRSTQIPSAWVALNPLRRLDVRYWMQVARRVKNERIDPTDLAAVERIVREVQAGVVSSDPVVQDVLANADHLRGVFETGRKPNLSVRWDTRRARDVVEIAFPHATYTVHGTAGGAQATLGERRLGRNGSGREALSRVAGHAAGAMVAQVG